MKTNNELKQNVNEKYAEIAKANQDCSCSCCGTGNIMPVDYTIMSDDYSQVDGYFSEADLGLGCGMPTEHAGIKSGDTVLDLGSGAGNDVFIARRECGRTGKVIGLDFTDEMLDKARHNCIKLGYTNVEFIKGDIESIPLEDSQIDVIISNCVLNLVPDKQKAFAEMYRVLKPKAHFCVSDIVLNAELPTNIAEAATMYAGCVSGAVLKDEYIKIIENSGFKNIEIVKTKDIQIPEVILQAYLTKEEIETFVNNKSIIQSVTVKAVK